MIVFPKKVEDYWLLHILIGPESQIDFDLNGSLEFDMEEMMLKHNINSKKIVLKIVYVNSEQETAERLNQLLSHINFMEEMNKKIKSMKNNEISDEINKGNLQDGIFLPNEECPFCKAKGVFIQAGKTTACKKCIEIEDGLEKLLNTKPPKRKPRKPKNNNEE